MPSSPPLATDRNVAASPHSQDLAALLFLYRQVLGIEPGNIEQGVHAKHPLRLPVVFTRE